MDDPYSLHSLQDLIRFDEQPKSPSSNHALNITSIDLSEEEFDSYMPRYSNSSNSNIFDWDDPADAAILNAANPRCIWTWVDGAEDEVIIVAGARRVNRIGYYVTEVPWADEQQQCVIKC